MKSLFAIALLLSAVCTAQSRESTKEHNSVKCSNTDLETSSLLSRQCGVDQNSRNQNVDALFRTDEKSDEPSGRGHCHPIAPFMTNLSNSDFASNLWYVDSASAKSWLVVRCNVFKFEWHASPFTHHNLHYDGFTTYYWKFDHPEYFNCAGGCHFARQGYLHGWIGQVQNGHCYFNESATTSSIDEQSTHNRDPCHPHYPYHRSLWVLQTDYHQSALVWWCAGSQAQVTLLSRNRQPLSETIRKQALDYLHQHGYTGQLYAMNNSGC